MRKQIYYMDLDAIEYGSNLTPLEQIAHEQLLTTRDWDSLFFWMDIGFSLAVLSNYEGHCFVLNLIEGYTEEEIARRLNVSHQMVSIKIKKAKIKIRNFLKEGYKAP